MLNLTILDKSAEARNILFHTMSDLLDKSNPEVALLSTINLSSVSLKELQHKNAPDILIVGPEILHQDMAIIKKIKETVPETEIIAKVAYEEANIPAIENLLRFGASEVIEEGVTTRELLKKIVVLKGKASQKKSGKLILIDSAKGGVGVTSIAAGIAEALYLEGYKTLLIDLDSSSQALSRFLQVRPFINETLQEVFSGERVVNEESASQAATAVFDDDELTILTPPSKEEIYFAATTEEGIRFKTVLEILDSQYEYLVVDMARVRGHVRSILLSAANAVIAVTSPDPASIHSLVQDLKKTKTFISPDTELYVLENRLFFEGVPSKLIKKELEDKLGEGEFQFIDAYIPFSKAASKWIASGESMFSVGEGRVKGALLNVLVSLGIKKEKKKEASSLLGALRKKIILKDKDSSSRILLGHTSSGSQLSEPRLLNAPGEGELISQAKLV